MKLDLKKVKDKQNQEGKQTQTIQKNFTEMESSEQDSINNYDNGKQTLKRYQDVLAVFYRLR